MNVLSKFILLGLSITIVAAVIPKAQKKQSDTPSSQFKAITVQAEQLESALRDGPWVSPGTSEDKALYQISFRTCPPCITSHDHLFPALIEAGIDSRFLSFARRKTVPDAEKAVLADIYNGRDWGLSSRWWADSRPDKFYAQNYATASSSDEIDAAVQSGVDSVAVLRKVLKANGVDMGFPTHLWQDEAGVWRVNVGYNKRVGRKILSELSD